MEKIFIKQAIIVEGKYDKIKIGSFVDTLIITSDGFRIFKDKEKLALIREIAKRDGIIILTDSDVAGFKLRSYLKSVAKDAEIINIYIPQIKGKEKRKPVPSKQGLLGVEGIDINTLKALFEKAGVIGEISNLPKKQITKMDFYQDGFIGKQNSAQKRQELLEFLNLPNYLSTNSLLEIINRIMTTEQYIEYLKITTTQGGI